MSIILTLAVMALLLIVVRAVIVSNLGRLTSRLKVLDVENAVLAAKLRHAEERRIKAEQQAEAVGMRRDTVRAVVSDMATEIEVLKARAKFVPVGQSEGTRANGPTGAAGDESLSST